MNIHAYFHERNQKREEIERWFEALDRGVRASISKANGVIRGLAMQSILFQDQAWLVIDDSAPGQLKIANGMASIVLLVNRPLGWITVEARRKRPFGVAEISIGGISPEIKEFEHAAMLGFGVLEGCVHVRQVVERLESLLLEDNLTTVDWRSLGESVEGSLAG